AIGGAGQETTRCQCNCLRTTWKHSDRGEPSHCSDAWSYYLCSLWRDDASLDIAEELDKHMESSDRRFRFNVLGSTEAQILVGCSRPTVLRAQRAPPPYS